MRRERTHSIELVEATAVTTNADRQDCLYSMVSRLLKAIEERFELPSMIGIAQRDPERRTAFRISVQLIDEGAADTEIRRLHRIDMAAYDDFVDRERPKLLAPKPNHTDVKQ